MPRTEFDGILRCRVTVVSPKQIRIEWWDEETKEVIWKETVSLPVQGYSAISQIVCSGSFKPAAGYFMDEFGMRHFRMTAEPGALSAMAGP